MPLALTSLAAEPTPGALKPARLRCENLPDPLGLDRAAPRLSWVVESATRGQVQTAYRVIVASSADALARDTGDLWDTGKVAADQTEITYAGKPLAANQRCAWKVQVWDRDGAPSAWSAPATFGMGLLAPADFKAQWIGYDASRKVDLPDADFGAAKWIGFANDKHPDAPKGHRLYVRDFALPAGAKVTNAQLIASADDRIWFVVNAQQVAGPGGKDSWKQPNILDVTPQVKAGANTLRVQVENALAGPTGLIARLDVTTDDGKTTTIVTDASWHATDNPGANWHNRPIDPAAWPNAIVVGDYGAQPWGKLKAVSVITPPPAYLRGTFKADKPVARATLYATALGIFDAYLNGQRVSEDWFNPGWTDYTKRVYYRAHDVTGRIRQGDNALGAILADGWFSGYVGYGHKRDHYGAKPRFAAQLLIEYTDGTSATVTTGPDWKAYTGPIAYSDFLMGEEFDARRAEDGWSQPGFDDGKWAKPDAGSEEVKPVLQWHPGPAVVTFAEVKPVKFTEPTPGAHVINMGQNFAGVVRLKLANTKPGQKVTLRFAERLNPDGTIYTTNLRSARATDVYVCRGAAEETWTPRFTFHGFQYVEITGLASAPAPDTITGLALSSNTPVVGDFECSDPMINQLHSNILWTQRMNFIDIPTDCPQRDERLGWTGDAQVYIRTASLNADVRAFFDKWLVDLADGQRADGQFPMVAPVKVAEADGGPAWADAGVICPWTVYEVYGDKRVLERQYPSMKKFIEFCRARSTPEMLPPAKYHCFGDWLSIKADTPKDVIYTAYFAQSTRLTARAAEVLGHADEARQYAELYEKIKASFNKAYVAPDGRIRVTAKDGKTAGDTQTCYVLALAFDLVDGEKAAAAAKYLVEDIERRGNHLSTGFIGTKDLMLVLAKIGRNDVAYKLLHNDTFPSWGFSIRHGATSIWERWDGWTPDKGFQDPGMNSFAHYSFGAVYQWIVENVGGIRNEAGVPTYKRLLIAPQIGGKLTSARTAYDGPRGKIETAWKIDGGKLILDVTIPANSTATILVPSANPAGVTEGGKPLGEAAGLKVLPARGGAAVFEAGSGTYHFESQLGRM